VTKSGKGLISPEPPGRGLALEKVEDPENPN